MTDRQQKVTIAREPNRSTIERLAHHWAYTLEETAEIYAVLVAEAAVPPPVSPVSAGDAGEIDRLRRELEEARKALETAKTQIIAAYRVWVADDVTAFPTPMSQAGEAIAKIDAALRAEEGGK